MDNEIYLPFETHYWANLRKDKCPVCSQKTLQGRKEHYYQKKLLEAKNLANKGTYLHIKCKTNTCQYEKYILREKE